MQRIRAVAARRLEKLRFSHSVNRFLLRENYTPQDLFDEVKGELVLEGGIVSVDDSVLDKPYSNPEKSQLIDYFWVTVSIKKVLKASI